MPTTTLVRLMIVATILTVGCQRDLPAPGAAAANPPMMRVVAAKPQRKTIVRRSEQPGQVEAFEQTPVYAKVSGFVSKIHVEFGDRVVGPKFDDEGNETSPGQMLAEISVPELSDELRQKQALVAQAIAGVEQAVAAIKAAESAQVAAEAYAAEVKATGERTQADLRRHTLDHERLAALFASKAVTQKVVDEASSQLDAAEAAVREAAAKAKSAAAVIDQRIAAIELARADQTAAAAKVRVAEADEQRMEALRRYTTLHAPFDGIVTARNVDLGHLLQPGKNATDQPLFVIVRADIVRVFIDVPEADAPFVQTGNEALVRIPSSGGSKLPAKVTRTAWALHPSTRTLRTEIDVPNSDGLLRPGMYVHADLKLAERQDVLVLPKGAVLSQDTQPSCLCVDSSGKIIRVPIKTGLRAGDDVEIVDGLTGDEQVIVANAAQYREGQQVEVTAPVAK